MRLPVEMTGYSQWRRAMIPTAVVALLGVLGASALHLRRIDRSRTYRIGTRIDPLSQSAAPDGRLDRLAIAVVSEAARRAGIRLQWIKSPEGHAEAFRLKRIDLWPLLTIMPERKTAVHSTDSWLPVERCLITKGSPGKDWKGATVAYGLGPVSLLHSSLPGAQLVYKGNDVAAIGAVCRGEAQGALVLVQALGALLLRRPAGCETVAFEITRLPETRRQLAIGSSLGTAGVANLLRAQIGRMAAEGVLTDFFNRHAIYAGAENEAVYQLVDAQQRSRLLTYGAVGLALVLTILIWQIRRARVARRAADRANLAKSEFLANMSHEIRTPLNGIAGMVEVLARTKITADQREMVEIIQQSSESLIAIVNDILDLSKIEAGAMQVDDAVFDIYAAVESVAKLLGPQAAAKGLTLETAFDPLIRRAAKGDPLRLRQVLLNLCANAIKFTDAGKIRMEVLPAGDQSEGTAALFRVIDTGIGIERKVADRLFHAFVQADTATTRKYGGTGLGLAISRRLVMLMGGSIGVESTPGRGSTFWFVIPLAAAPDLPAPAVQPAVRVEAPQAAPANSGRVLIVDDNPINQIVAVRAVHNLGYQTAVAGSGEAALEAIAHGCFDLILLDCQMPGMDGYQTAEEIRRREGPALRVPIVAMTANSVDGDEERCAAAGMDGYMTKPLRMATLGEVLHRWIRQPELCDSTSRRKPAA